MRTHSPVDTRRATLGPNNEVVGNFRDGNTRCDADARGTLRQRHAIRVCPLKQERMDAHSDVRVREFNPGCASRPSSL